MEYGNGERNDLIWKKQDNRYHNSEIEKVTLENENVNTAVLGRLVEPGSRVLDIGCGEGKFGAILRSRNCIVYGVDLDRTAAEYAKKNYGYQDIFCFDLEHFADDPEEKRLRTLTEPFDDLALLDVLEHVINPTAVMRNALTYLKDGGKVLLSVPNVNNADIFLNLLRDHFHYCQSGVLDNTHCKYFTRTSFLEWIHEINKEYDFSLDCSQVGSIYGMTDYMEKIKKNYPYVYRFLEGNPSFHTIQHLYCLTYRKKKCETPELDRLLKEKEPDLVPFLEKCLSEGNIEGFLQGKLLENERSIMEKQIASANKGWKECADALKGANEYAAHLEKDLAELKAYARHLEKDIEEEKAYAQQLEKDLAEVKAYGRYPKGYAAKRKTCAGPSEKDAKKRKACAEPLDKDAKKQKACVEPLDKDAKKQKACVEPSEKDAKKRKFGVQSVWKIIEKIKGKDNEG